MSGLQLQLHGQYPPTSSVQGLDPGLEALVARLVEARLQDADSQFTEQNKAWKPQEAEMLNRETVMCGAIETLNAQLAAARSEARQIHLLVLY